MTSDTQHQHIEQLLRERARYVREGRVDLVVEVDAELRRVGAQLPRERATRMDVPNRVRL